MGQRTPADSRASAVTLDDLQLSPRPAGNGYLLTPGQQAESLSLATPTEAAVTHWEDGLAAPTIAAGLAAVAQNGQRIYFLCFQSGRQAGVGVGVRVGVRVRVGVGIRAQALAATAAVTFCPGSRVPRPALCWGHHEALGHVGVGTPGAAMTAGCEVCRC